MENLSKASGESQAYQRELVHSEQEVQSLRNRLEEELKRLRVSEESEKKLSESLSRANADLDGAKKEIVRSTADIGSLRSELEEGKKRSRDLEDREVKLTEKLSKANADIDLGRAELDRLLIEVENYQSRMEEKSIRVQQSEDSEKKTIENLFKVNLDLDLTMKELDRSVAEIDSLRKRLEDESSRAKSLETSNYEFREKLIKCNLDLEAIKKEQARLEDEKESFAVQINEKSMLLIDTSDNSKKLTEKYSKAVIESEQAKQAVSRLTADLQTCHLKLEEECKRSQKLDENVRDLTESLTMTRAEHEISKKEIARYRNDVENLQAELEEISTRLRSSESICADLNETLSKGKLEAEFTGKEVSGLTAELEVLKKKLSETEQLFRDSEESNQKLSIENVKYSVDLEVAREGQKRAGSDIYQLRETSEKTEKQLHERVLRLKTKLDEEIKSRRALEQNIAEVSVSLAKSNSELEVANFALARTHSSEEKLQDQLKEEIDKSCRVEEENAVLRENISKVRADWDTSNRELARANASSDRLQSLLDNESIQSKKFERDNASLRESLSKASFDLEALGKEYARTSSNLETLRKELNECKEQKDQKQKDCEVLNERLSKYTADFDSASTELSRSNESLKKLQTSALEDSQRLKELEEACSTLRVELKENGYVLQASELAKKEKISMYEAQITGLKEMMKESKTSMSKSIQELHMELENVLAENKNLKTTVDRLEELKLELRGSNIQLTGELENIKKDLIRTSLELKKLEDVVEVDKKLLEEAESKKMDLQQTVAALKIEVDSAKVDIVHSEAEIQKLRVKLTEEADFKDEMNTSFEHIKAIQFKASNDLEVTSTELERSKEELAIVREKLAESLLFVEKESKRSRGAEETLAETKGSLAAATAEFIVTQKCLVRADSETELLRRRVEGLQKSLDEETKRARASEENNSELRGSLSKATADIVALERENLQLNSSIERLQHQIDEESPRLKAFEETNTHLRTKLSTSLIDHEGSKRELNRVEQELIFLRAKLESESKLAQDYGNSNQNLMEKLSSSSTVSEEMQIENRRMALEIENLRRRVDDLVAQQLELESVNKSLVEKYNNATVDLELAKVDSTRHEHQVQSLNMSLEREKNGIMTARTDLEVAEREIVRLRTEVESQKKELIESSRSLREVYEINADLKIQMAKASLDVENTKKELDQSFVMSEHTSHQLKDINLRLKDAEELNRSLQDELVMSNNVKEELLRKDSTTESLLQRQNEALESEIRDLRNTLQATEESRAQACTEKDASQVALNEANIQLQELGALRTQVVDFTDELSALKAELNDSRYELSDLQNTSFDLETANSNAHEEILRLNYELEESKSSKAFQESVIEEMDGEIRTLQADLAALQEEKVKNTEELDSEIKKVRRESQCMSQFNDSVLKDLSASLEDRSSEIAVLRAEVEVLKAEKCNFECELENARGSDALKGAELARANNRIIELEENIELSKERERFHQQEILTLKKQVESSSSKEDLSSLIQMFETEIAMLKKAVEQEKVCSRESTENGKVLQENLYITTASLVNAEKELETLQKQVFEHDSFERDKELKKLRVELADVYRALEERMKVEENTEIVVLQEKTNNANKEIIATKATNSEERVTILTAELSNLSDELMGLRDVYETVKEAKIKADGEVEVLSQILRDAVDSHDAEISTMRTYLDDLGSERDGLIAKLSTEETNKKEMENVMSMMNEEIKELHDQVFNAREALDVAERTRKAEVVKVRRESVSMKAFSDSLLRDLSAELKETTESGSDMIASLEAELQIAKAEVARVKDALEMARDTNIPLEEEISQLKDTVEKKSEQNIQLSLQLEELLVEKGLQAQEISNMEAIKEKELTNMMNIAIEMNTGGDKSQSEAFSKILLENERLKAENAFQQDLIKKLDDDISSMKKRSADMNVIETDEYVKELKVREQTLAAELAMSRECSADLKKSLEHAIFAKATADAELTRLSRTLTSLEEESNLQTREREVQSKEYLQVMDELVQAQTDLAEVSKKNLSLKSIISDLHAIKSALEQQLADAKATFSLEKVDDKQSNQGGPLLESIVSVSAAVAAIEANRSPHPVTPPRGVYSSNPAPFSSSSTSRHMNTPEKATFLLDIEENDRGDSSTRNDDASQYSRRESTPGIVTVVLPSESEDSLEPDGALWTTSWWGSNVRRESTPGIVTVIIPEEDNDVSAQQMIGDVNDDDSLNSSRRSTLMGLFAQAED